VHLVEQARAPLTAIRANVTALALPDVHVHAAPVVRFVTTEVTPAFDVVFLDPPYAEPVDAVLAALIAHDRVALDGVVVVERSARDHDLRWPDGLVADRSRRYGDSTLWYGRRP
jgi:16S rRNA (guanine966-N2)-methyltransferase